MFYNWNWSKLERVHKRAGGKKNLYNFFTDEKKAELYSQYKIHFFDFPLTLASFLCVAILQALQHVPCLGFWLSCARDPSALQRPLRGHPSPGPHCNLGIDFCSPCPLINHQGRRCIPKQAAVGGKGQAVPLTWPPKHLQEGFVQGEKTTLVKMFISAFVAKKGNML